MYLRVVRTTIKQDMLDEAIRIFCESILPTAQTQKGFKSIHLLTDRQVSTVQSVSLWETEADLQAGEASGYYQEQIAKLGAVLTE